MTVEIFIQTETKDMLKNRFLTAVTLCFTLVFSTKLLAHAEYGVNHIDLVKVVKSKNRMYLISHDKVVKEYHVALGPNPKGHKQREGDNKTPEGVYTLDFINEDSDFYRSMHISYPNRKDRQDAKKRGDNPGGMIMIHGQKNGREFYTKTVQEFNWTNGCIALTNDEMDEFLELVPTGTDIQISWN